MTNFHLFIVYWFSDLSWSVFICSDSGNTGLHYAAAGGHSEVYYCLLQHGADSELCNNSGDNPLDIARKHGKRQAISKAGELINMIRSRWCSLLLTDGLKSSRIWLHSWF